MVDKYDKWKKITLYATEYLFECVINILVADLKRYKNCMGSCFIRNQLQGEVESQSSPHIKTQYFDKDKKTVFF